MTEFVEVPTSELEGSALDWAVAKAENVFVHIGDPELGEGLRLFFISGKHLPCVVRYQPSSDWRFGGPLIEKYNIGFGIYESSLLAVTGHNDFAGDEHGPTHLIAACRAIVSAVLGSSVNVPKELTV